MLTRFAPSPTGELHLGHAFSAILAHDAARAAGGTFRLRIDDIDGSRSREAFVGAALADLEWLGLTFDGAPVRQSQHLGDYAAALADLRDRGLVYPCFCTRADIAASLAAPHGAPADGAPLYPGTCRHLGAAERERRLAQEAHCWRLDMASAGASTIDDAAMGVTLVVRGADLIASTDVHRLLQALLGFRTPLYRHHALVCGADGKRLAKRDGAAALAALRAAGVDGRALADDLRAGRLPAGYSLQMP